jgi:Spy/CpxP family protein refolding chaperone
MSKRVLYALLGSGALVVSLVAVAARPIAAAIQGAGGLGGFHHGWAGHHGFQAMSPEAAKEHIQVAAKWALRDVDASEQQQERVSAIAADAVDDLFRLRQRHLENREAFHAQLGGASVDRAALEEIRKSEMALADEASKRFVRALADMADVLTPEQRQALMEKLARRHQR